MNHASASSLVELLSCDLVGGFCCGLIAGGDSFTGGANAVFRLDFTATLRLWAFSLVRTRFFCDLMFATISPNDVLL